MRKFSLLLILGLLITISPTLYAQINVSGALNRASKEINKSKKEKEDQEKAIKEQEEQEKTKKEQEKDYPLLSRFEGAEKVYENITKWEEYKLPVNSANNNLQWDAYTKLEGKIIRYQYNVSPDNNPAYLLKMYENKLENSGFEVIFSKKGSDMDISSGSFCSKYYSDLGNSKFGFKYVTKGKDHSFIAGKINKEGKNIFVAIYISGFDNTTLITQDIIEAESIKEQKAKISYTAKLDGAELWEKNNSNISEYTVITGPTKEGKLVSSIKLIGKTAFTTYKYRGENNAFGIIYNYTEFLKEKGFEILLSCKGGECGSGMAAFYTGLNKFEFGDDNIVHAFGSRNFKNYLSAKKHVDEMDVYVCVYIAQGWWSYPVLRVDVIESKPQKTKMISSENISTSIFDNGSVAIYGIHFETGQSVIKAESHASLKSIADFLNSNTDKSFYIVGHTDNVGDFAENKILSDNRAKSVKDRLVNEYNVKGEQLDAYGVSSLSPVASNSTDEGKAQNRRVEIVEQ
ncbi:MAG: OmpA family protein [Bacteroidales bacterium]|jgi:OOP family OmpA-OmpF porin|nr:OmpA family protein [Bacteroidales bacterium]